MTQAAGHAVPDDRGTHRLTDDQPETGAAESNPDPGIRRIRCVHENVYHQVPLSRPPAAPHRPGEVGTLVQPVRLRKHPDIRGSAEPPNRLSYRRRGLRGSADRASDTEFDWKSGGEAGAALTAPRGDDGAARTGPHPKTETVDPRPTTVVRLERPLALGHGQHSSNWWAPCGARSFR
jgi:hypothetical protein